MYTLLDRGTVLIQSQLEIFTQRNFVAKYIRFKLIFIHTMINLFFEPPFGGIRGNVWTSSIAHWKALGRLPIHDN